MVKSLKKRSRLINYQAQRNKVVRLIYASRNLQAVGWQDWQRRGKDVRICSGRRQAWGH